MPSILVSEMLYSLICCLGDPDWVFVICLFLPSKPVKTEVNILKDLHGAVCVARLPLLWSLLSQM